LPFLTKRFHLFVKAKNAGLCLLLVRIVAFFLDAGLLTSEVAQVVELSATHLADLVDGDAVDGRRVDGEDTLYANGAAHLAYGEALLVAMTADLDDYSAEELDSLLVTLYDFVSNGNCVA